MRKINTKLFDHFEKQLRTNALAKEAVERKNARLLFLCANQALVGVREAGGNNHGKLVELLQETIGSAVSEPWCMSAQQSCLAYVEERLGVISPVYPSEHCLTVWHQTPKPMRVKNFPLAGAIIIWVNGKGPEGHTGCLESTDGQKMWAYEGNTTAGFDAKGNVVREGGGFYRNLRGFRGNGSLKVVGFIKPFI